MSEKFKDRQEQRKVTETMNALLLPMTSYLNNETKAIVEKALRVLNSVEIVKELPTADVVERSKIDKDIEDLKTEYCECKKACSECIKNDHPYRCTCLIPLHEVLEFLNDKINVGE